MRCLIAYFSYEGPNSVNFDVKEVKKGHTRIEAEILNNLVNRSKLVRIEPVDPYPADYEELCKIAKEEYNNNIERDIKPLDINMNDYDLLYIGFPIWYRSYPRVISKFLKSIDLNGKYVIPFCTNEEGSFGMADMELDKLISSLGGCMIEGYSVKGSEAKSDEEKLKAFLERRKML